MLSCVRNAKPHYVTSNTAGWPVAESAQDNDKSQLEELFAVGFEKIIRAVRGKTPMVRVTPLCVVQFVVVATATFVLFRTSFFGVLDVSVDIKKRHGSV